MRQVRVQRLTRHPKIFLHSFSDKIFKKGKGDKREDASRNNSAEESIVVQTYLKKGMDDVKDCLG